MAKLNYVSLKETIFLAILIVPLIFRTNLLEVLFDTLYRSTHYAKYAIFIRCGINRFATKDPDAGILLILQNLSLNMLRHIFIPLIGVGYLDLPLLLELAKFTIMSTCIW